MTMIELAHFSHGIKQQLEVNNFYNTKKVHNITSISTMGGYHSDVEEGTSIQ